MAPFCAIYSTFLQRAYDQVVHDVAIQSLPVRFAIDRAGPVGADGATHAGSFDLAYLGCLPGIVIMAPSDEAELVHAVATLASIHDRPSAVRYPRGEGTGAWRCRRGARSCRSAAAASCARGATWRSCALGPRLADCLEGGGDAGGAGDQRDGGGCAVCQAARHSRWSTIWRRGTWLLVTIEDGSVGGFGAAVMQHLAWSGGLDRGTEDPPDDAARPVPGSRRAGEAVGGCRADGGARCGGNRGEGDGTRCMIARRPSSSWLNRWALRP